MPALPPTFEGKRLAATLTPPSPRPSRGEGKGEGPLPSKMRNLIPPVKDVLDMDGPAPWQHRHHVESHGQPGEILLSRQPQVGRTFDAPFRLMRDGLHRGGKGAARLDLDDQHEVSTPCDQTDLAEPRPVAAGDDAKSLQRQRRGRQPLARMAAFIGLPPPPKRGVAVSSLSHLGVPEAADTGPAWAGRSFAPPRPPPSRRASLPRAIAAAGPCLRAPAPPRGAGRRR